MMSEHYVKAEYIETAGREIDGELIVGPADNTDGGTGVVSLTVQDFEDGHLLMTIQLDRKQLADLIKGLQAFA
jgi:hypothetical protein